MTFIVVKGVVLPEPEDDADPFEGQSAHGSVMRFSSAQEVLINRLWPKRSEESNNQQIRERSGKGTSGDTSAAGFFRFDCSDPVPEQYRFFSASGWGQSRRYDLNQKPPSAEELFEGLPRASSRRSSSRDVCEPALG